MSILYQVLIAPLEAVMHVALSAIYAVTASHGVSIFLLSMLINVALFPLFQMAERWQDTERRIQKQLKPKLEQFKQAFSGEERHVMIHTLYRQAGYHPIYAMRSSVGLFLQLPFWIAAYQLLSQYQPLNGSSFLIFEDLGQPDRLLGGVNLLPFVMTALNLVAAFIYTKGLTRVEQIQPIVLAALFLVLLYGAPAGLLLYWTFNSLFSLLRIALLSPMQAWHFTRTKSGDASSQLIPSKPRSIVESTGGVEQHGGKSHFDLGSIQDERRRNATHFLDRPMIINIALFIVTIVAQASVHLDQFAVEGGILRKSSWITTMLIATSIVILVYLCWVFSLKASRGTKKDLRQRSNIALVWLSCAALVVIDIAWLSDAYPNLHPARAIGGILLVLLLLFGSPFFDRIPITKDMPNSHWLYAISMSLSTFVLFLGNPIGLYVSSSDFVGGVYNVAIILCVFFVIAVFSLTALYLLMDSAARKVLTLMFVFLAVIVVAYSAMGVKDAGIMSQFLLPLPKGLGKTSNEMVVEIILLLSVLSVTICATIKYRQNMTYVMGAMLVTSICVTVADIHLAKGDEVIASKELPIDHVDIVSFSRDRNILIIMLDGFPGGYLQRIMDEVQEVLREYEGFTWFPNTVTTNADTLGAIATLAGGPRYRPDEINRRNYESVGRAINESYNVYIDAFVPKDYQVTYVNPVFAGGCDRLGKRIHCTETFPYGVYYHNKEEPDVPLLQGDSHVPLILAMVSALKASPFFLKSWVYDSGNYRGTNSTVVRHTAANSSKVKEWGFLRVLSHESRADSRSKTFKFIQLSIPHPPNALDANCKMQPEEATVFTEAVCALKEIGALLSWMKQTGIYDTTKIVVVSDHGWYVDNPMFPPSFEKTLPKLEGWLSMPGIVHPLLLAKDFEARGNFRRSDTFLSNSDVPSMVCSAIEACTDVGSDPTKIDHLGRTLTFSLIRYPPEEVQAKKFDIVTTFEVKNSIFDPQNWRKIN